MAYKIKHLGIVENINGSCLKVRIVQTSACGSCGVRGHCSAADAKEKSVDVINDKQMECRVGQQVMIEGASSLGLKAVAWAFVCPFLVMLVSLFAAMNFSGGNEPLSALVALGMLAPYYAGLYFFRNRLKRTFVFTLESIIN